MLKGYANSANLGNDLRQRATGRIWALGLCDEGCAFVHGVHTLTFTCLIVISHLHWYCVKKVYLTFEMNYKLIIKHDYNH